MKKLLLSGLLVYTILAVAYGFVLRHYLCPQQAGLFGDMYGAFNSFFTGLAFIGLVVALSLQSREFRATEKAQSAQLAIQTSMDYKDEVSAAHASLKLFAPPGKCAPESTSHA